MNTLGKPVPVTNPWTQAFKKLAMDTECEACKKKFANAYSWRRHMTTKHNGNFKLFLGYF